MAQLNRPEDFVWGKGIQDPRNIKFSMVNNKPQTQQLSSTSPNNQMKTSAINQSYNNIIGGGKGGGGGSLVDEIGKIQKGLDNLFSYQGTRYGDMPSYKVGGGGGQSLDRLAQMMGGQIYNPYQYARMTSSGSSSGEFPYKSLLAGQEAAAQAKLQKARGEQEMLLQTARGEQEAKGQRERMQRETEMQRQQQKAAIQAQLSTMKYGTPEYFELRNQMWRM